MNSAPMLMGDGLRRNAWKFPVKIAVKDRFREISYADLNARVNRLANGLLSIGVKRGDAVALSVGNRIEHLEIIFATAKIGAILVNINPAYRAQELEYALRQSGCATLIIAPPFKTSGVGRFYLSPTGVFAVTTRDSPNVPPV